MNNVKVKELIKFSLSKYFQNKWFVVFNLLSLIGVLIVPNHNALADLLNINEDKEYTIEIITQDDNVYNELEAELINEEKIHITRIDENNYTANTIPKETLVLEINNNPDTYFDATLTSKESILRAVYDKIEDAVDKLKSKTAMEEFDLSEEKFTKITSKVEIERVTLAVDSSDYSTKELIKTLSAAFTYMIAIILFSKIANEISQEKQSKSSEYILTTVSGKEYLFARVFGNILILLIQFLLFIGYLMISLIILSLYKSTTTDISLATSLSISIINKDMVVYIATLIILNVLFFTLLSIVQGTIAAKTSSSQEAGSTVSIIFFVMMLLYFLTLILIDPNKTVSVPIYILSVLPLFSAFFVPAMMVIGQSTVWQVVISIVLLIISIPITFRVCGKMFKEGLLDYTKTKKSKKEELTLEEKQSIYINKRTFKNLGMVLGISILIVISTSTVFSILYSITISPLLKPYISSSDDLLLLQGVTQTISFMLAFCFIKLYLSKAEKLTEQGTKEQLEQEKTDDKKKFKPSKLHILLMCFGSVFLINLLLSYLYSLLKLNYDASSTFEIMPTSGLLTKVLTVLVLSIIPSIFEELLFRKALIDLLKKYGIPFAIITSSLLFGLIHGNITQGIFAFSVGIIFAITYVLTNDIKISIVAHALNNGLQAISLVLPYQYQMPLLVITFILVATGIYYIFRFIKERDPFKSKSELCESIKSPYTFKKSYKYLFYDLIFDVSLLLTLALFIVAKKIT